ncbi:hypothetical protein RRF57_001804 [Xylaria bambusicola]|uniref:Dockerin type 1 n=1 Tax=Xylaria bambusicola TaxID=326684 RepID=A0AAN7URK5_9PEZI
MASKSILSAAIVLVHAVCAAAVPLNQAATGTVAAAAPPATFTPNPNVGPGRGNNYYTDSAHFRLYGASGTQASASLNMLEAAYDCYINTMGWRSSGLSYNSATDDGPFYKVNIYSVGSLGGSAGVMHSDAASGLAWLEVLPDYLANPWITVHEWGHGITYAERYWSATATEINLRKIIGDSYQVLVDGSVNTGNYYEAWPFLSYITANPDGYVGLGLTAVRDMIRKYNRGSNETPLHSLDRIATSTTAQAIVARYWARMAYVFLQQRDSLNYANLDAQGNAGTYKVKRARQPRYMGANVIPLKKSGAVTVTAKVTANKAFTATLSVRNTSTGVTRYVDLVNGSGSTAVSADEEASLVVVNTPASLILFDPFSLSSDVQAGLDYTVTLTGATA